MLGLNSVSDGYNVVIAPRATGFERQLRERGYNPIGVDLSELLLGGGGVRVLHPGAAPMNEPTDHRSPTATRAIERVIADETSTRAQLPPAARSSSPEARAPG